MIQGWEAVVEWINFRDSCWGLSCASPGRGGCSFFPWHSWEAVYVYNAPEETIQEQARQWYQVVTTDRLLRWPMLANYLPLWDWGNFFLRLIYLCKRITQREDRKILYLLGHSPNNCNSWVWARLKPGAPGFRDQSKSSSLVLRADRTGISPQKGWQHLPVMLQN